MRVARSVEDFFYEPFQVLRQAIIPSAWLWLCGWRAALRISRTFPGIGAGHNPLGLAVGVARSVEDFFYEPFQVLGLAIIPSAWVLGTEELYLVLCCLLRTLQGVGLAKICLQKSHLKGKKKEVCLLNR